MTDTRIFEPDGRGIPYVDEGAGPALVLIPGRGLDIASLGTLAHVLTEEDFRVVRIGSRRPSADAAGLAALAQDIVDVMDEIDLADAWIGGHAFGGTVARAVALAHTERANGVLLLGVDDARTPSDDAARAIATVFSEETDGDLRDALAQLVGEGVDVEWAWSVLSHARDLEVAPLQSAALASSDESAWRPVAPALPVLVLQGASDTVTPPALGEALRATAPDRVSVVTLDGAGHLFPTTHPGETAAVIEDYLDWD